MGSATMRRAHGVAADEGTTPEMPASARAARDADQHYPGHAHAIGHPGGGELILDRARTRTSHFPRRQLSLIGVQERAKRGSRLAREPVAFT